MSLAVGLALLATSILMLILGLPTQGEVRPFLGRNGVQAMYAVVMVAIGSAGAVITINALARMAG